MTEVEWRNLGVTQSRGWIHYMIHRPGMCVPRVSRAVHSSFITLDHVHDNCAHALQRSISCSSSVRLTASSPRLFLRFVCLVYILIIGFNNGNAFLCELKQASIDSVPQSTVVVLLVIRPSVHQRGWCGSARWRSLVGVLGLGELRREARRDDKVRHIRHLVEDGERDCG